MTSSPLDRQTDGNVGRGLPSPPINNTLGRTTLGMARHHNPLKVHTVGLRRECHNITAFGQHIRSNEVGHGMPSSPLGSTHGRTTLGVACHHILWTAHTVELYRVWFYVTAVGLHAQSNDVGRRIPSLPLRSTHSQTTLCLARHHRLWTTHSAEGHRVWNAIITVGTHTRSNDVGRVMTSPPLDSTHGRTTSDLS